MTTEPNKESFRDNLSTVDSEGKRVWVYPKKPKGKFTNYRQLVSVGLLALLFSAPFVRIGGEPLVLFNILERKFILLGQDWSMLYLRKIALF